MEPGGGTLAARARVIGGAARWRLAARARVIAGSVRRGARGATDRAFLAITVEPGGGASRLGPAILRIAAEHHLEVTVPYPLEKAGVALADLAWDRITGAAVLVP